jgi:hypothetical protein
MSTVSLSQSREFDLSVSPSLLYRIAAVLFILFALGHTVGFLTLTPPTPESVAVRDSMSGVHFQVRGATLSYGGFYRGFGLNISAYLFFSSFLAWHLSGQSLRQPQAIGSLGWAFFALQLAGLALSWIYFAGAPVIFSGVMALCLGLAAFMARPTVIAPSSKTS